MKIFSIFILLVFLSGFAFSTEKTPRYTGSLTCKSCHQVQFAAWSDSHHSWAWRKPEPANILGDFNNVEFKHAGFTYRFIRGKSDFYIIADNVEGNAEKYRVHSVAGVTPLQQYLVDTGSGHLQTLDVAWNSEKKHWYHLYPDEDTSAGNGMHWTGSYKNWNSRCAECHATDFRKNYDPLKNSYTSQQAEIGVGCEACHGPGEAHLDWANAPEKFTSRSWKGTDEKGFTAAYQKNNAASEINLCAGCHSRREPIGANSPVPGSLYADHYRLAMLRDNLYFADGQTQEEVYVYGSFIQSKMHEKGVTCTNCHDAHSYRLKAKGNALCTQCHNPAGNALFPSLTNKEYDSSSHHFHSSETEGAECKQCHMPERQYMVVDGRRDHSFRIPRPDLSKKLGIPNVCNDCHEDKTPAWSVAEILKRYPEGNLNTKHFAEIFSAANMQLDDQGIKQLVNLAISDQMPAIVRASALDRLLPVTRQLNFKKLEPLLSDKSAWIRVSAANLLVMSSDKNKRKKLLPLLNDQVRSVRLVAVKGFLNSNLDDMSSSASTAVKKAMKEYQQSLLAKADFPETQMVIGGVALTRRNIPAAISAFGRAVKMDPQLTEAWMMLAKIHVAIGQSDEARQALKKAIKINPNSDELRKLIKSL